MQKTKWTDEQFRIQMLIIQNYIFNNNLAKVNFFFEDNKLINLTIDNFAHLIGLQYYGKVLKQKLNLFTFLKQVSQKKILWSSIVKKIQIEWKTNLSKKFAGSFKDPKDCINKLVFKVEAFITIIKKISTLKNKDQIGSYQFNNKNFVDYFLKYHHLNDDHNHYYLLGLKRISGPNYQFDTFKPITLKIMKKDIETYFIENWIVKKIKISSTK